MGHGAGAPGGGHFVQCTDRVPGGPYGQEVARWHRLTIRAIDHDARSDHIAGGAEQLGTPLPQAPSVADVLYVSGDLGDDGQRRLGRFLIDPLLQTGSWETPNHAGPAFEVTLHPGVTDLAAQSLLRAASQLGVAVDGAATGRRVEFSPDTDRALADTVVRRLVANPIIEHWGEGLAEPTEPLAGVATEPALVAVRDLDEAALAHLGDDRLLALDLLELRTIQEHFRSLGRDPTDVELEMLAQTWSEHCSHKTFRAAITVGSDERSTMLESLLGQLRSCTTAIGAAFVRSAFDGNAGIVSFVPGVTLALKAETHNHPSAVEPFGGANTGVGGVIRDILGAAHRPIAVTDVLCFGTPTVPADSLPAGTLHPRRIREGVIAGVADYGNKIGLPTVAGAVWYDDRFTTNPLVFCGCIGKAVERPRHEGPDPGDRVVVLGGRTGRDGIRGATFSSATMDASTGDVSGASVQIGDPVTEKLLIDVLDGAEDLYSAITDCGAGGLSSAVGEMADGVGADVDLGLVPRKYAGLAPWEVWLSEAQERMVVAVPPEHREALDHRCERFGVELADIGSFTGTGRLIVRSDGHVAADVDLEFLHGGRPERTMTAQLPNPERTEAGVRDVGDVAVTLLALLRHANLSSRAAVVHRYDHEIGGATLVRPLTANGGHADGVVLADPADDHGIAIGIGINPWYGLHDPEAMAAAVVDEAIRSVVAVGADPDRVALLDNFSWGDPRRPSTLGDLVAAVQGCCTAALAHATPFVSGKDSLNNEYADADGNRHAVPPTLVITAVGHVPDVSACVTTELATPGHHLVVLGRTRPEFAGSHLDDVLTSTGRYHPSSVVPQPDPAAPARYRRLHRAMAAGLVRACHDVSEGGLAVALAEMCIAGDLGARIDALPHDDIATALFSESTGRLLVEVVPADLEAFVATMTSADDVPTVLGEVTGEAALRLPGCPPIKLDDLVAAFETVP